jgi:hypothetical protein
MLEQGTFHSPLAKRTEHREVNIADDIQRGRTFAVPAFHILIIRLGKDLPREDTTLLLLNIDAKFLGR